MSDGFHNGVIQAKHLRQVFCSNLLSKSRHIHQPTDGPSQFVWCRTKTVSFIEEILKNFDSISTANLFLMYDLTCGRTRIKVFKSISKEQAEQAYLQWTYIYICLCLKIYIPISKRGPSIYTASCWKAHCNGPKSLALPNVKHFLANIPLK